MRKIYWFIILFIVLISPWIVNILSCPAGYEPIGLLAGGPDYPTFIGKIEYGRAGHWLYANCFTPEQTTPVPIYFFYLLLGHIADWVNISSIWIFHLIRSLLGAFTLLFWWGFCQRYKNPWIVCLIGLFASCGLLYSINPDQYMFVDLTIAGRALCWSLLGFPHYQLDFLGIILILKAYFDRQKTVLYSIVAGLLIGMVHPFLFLLILPVVLIHSLYTGKLKHGVSVCALVSAGSMPFVIPMAISFTTMPWLNEWREQTAMNFTLIENVYYRFGTFGLAGVISWASIYRFKKVDSETQFFYIWLYLAIAMSFLMPMANKREFLMFITVPIAIISTPLIIAFANKYSTLKYNVLLIMLVAISILFMAGNSLSVLDYRNPSRISKSLIDTFEYMAKNSDANDVLVCTNKIAIFLPLYQSKPRPYVAHTSETMNANVRRVNADKFFKSGYMEPGIDYKWALIDKSEKPKLPRLKEKPVFENSRFVLWKIGGD